MIYIHREADPDYPGHHVYVPRDAQGKQVAPEAIERDAAHDNANDFGFMQTQDV